MSANEHISLPDPSAIKVRTKKESLRLAAFISFGVALFVALIFAAVLVVIHANDKQALQTRRQAVITDCRQQNMRNGKTIKFFNSYVAAYERTHPTVATTEKRKLEAQVKADVTLINDLDPRQNCIKLARTLYPDQNTGFWNLIR